MAETLRDDGPHATEFIKLKHIYPNELPDQKFYFYEGEADVHYGVIELPRDPAFTHWAQRAWMKGFRLDPETGENVERDQLDVLLSGSAKSAGEAVEDTDAGRQPAGEDGLREGELTGSGSVSSEGLDGSLGDGDADEASGDDSPA
jgi:hypothetical protein